jgi:hypothetical protein
MFETTSGAWVMLTHDVLFRVGPPVVVVVAVVIIHCRDGGAKWVVQVGVGVGGDENVVIEGIDGRSGVRRGARMGVSEVVTGAN